MTARITIRGTDDEVLDVLESLTQVPDHDAALDLFEGAAQLSSGTYVLDLEVPSAGQPEVARGHRSDPSRVQRLEQEVDRQQAEISRLLSENHRLQGRLTDIQHGLIARRLPEDGDQLYERRSVARR